MLAGLARGERGIADVGRTAVRAGAGGKSVHGDDGVVARLPVAGLSSCAASAGDERSTRGRVLSGACGRETGAEAGAGARMAS